MTVYRLSVATAHYIVSTADVTAIYIHGLYTGRQLWPNVCCVNRWLAYTWIKLYASTHSTWIH